MSFASIFAREFSKAIVNRPKNRKISDDDQKIGTVIFWIFILIFLFTIQ